MRTVRPSIRGILPTMDRLPRRGPGARELGLAIPPARMPLLLRGRPLKRWRYVGVYGPDLMLCAGRARVGVIPQSFWGVVEPGRPVRDLTSLRGAGVRFDGSRVLIDSGGVQADLTVEER